MPDTLSWHLPALAITPRPGEVETVLDITSPGIISIPISAPRIRCQGFTFPDPFQSHVVILPAKHPAHKPQPPKTTHPPNRSQTRLKPPDDVIKLKDRLHYVLQPSVEALLAADTLDMPHRPFPYQLEGVGFLFPRHAAILADEMGLGKTMQAITALRLLLHAGEIRSVLLVCPKPLISNWQRELSHWAPEIPVTSISGSGPQRQWQWQRPDFPVKIANYELLVRDGELVSDGGIQPDLVLLDEAQRIKNSSSTTSKVVRSIQRTRSWALTGTPIENSCDDLVGIFEFLSTGLLSRTMTPRGMARAARDYILRRTKEEVLSDLPPKLFRDAELDLSRQQRDSYELAEKDGIVRLTEMGEGVTIQHVFELVLRLKQICNFDPATGESSKLERLRADLEEVAASGHKAIVFSQWVKTLERLADHLRQFHPLQYHGRISPRLREEAVVRFREQSEHSVMLMSYGAGSVGLNLQFTNYVFLFDRWWNPAVEDQAINRAHRIGVSGPVTVTRFVTLGTIEQRIDDILQEKRHLVDTVLGYSDQPQNLGLSQNEIFGLFRLRMPN